MEVSGIRPFVETLPPAIARGLAELRQDDEKVQMQVAADMTDDRIYGERWLVATDRELYVLSTNGSMESRQIPIDQVLGAQVQQLVGGGSLEIQCRGDAPIFLHYSNSLHPKFVEVAAGISRLVAGLDPELPTVVERTRCEKCERLLPEKDGFCPFCLSKWGTFKRIASFLLPYTVSYTHLTLPTKA